MKTRPAKFFEPILKENGWCRIHKSYFVNPKFVEHISEKRNSIYLHNGAELPISRRNKKSVTKWLSITFFQ
jgi:DNA-binding LytR/AlgR family response regulator